MRPWDRSEELRFLRMVDAVAALLGGPAGGTPAGRLVVRRLVTSMFALLVDNAAAEEERRAEACMAALQLTDVSTEAAVRRWLAAACRERAEEYDWDCEEEWHRIGPDHGAWALLDLDPLARRLRLWTATARISAVALGKTMGVGAHQIRHWAYGRSLPSGEHREALTEAMGVHPAWLAAGRDHSADSDLYLYGRCPCETGAGYALGAVAGSGAELVVRWCRGCAQPLLSTGDAGLVPLPPQDGDDLPGSYPDFRAVYSNGNMEWSGPWPHGLWCPGPNNRQRGAVRLPPLLSRPPLTAPRPAEPVPPAGAAKERRRSVGAAGPVPSPVSGRAGVMKIQAFLAWVGGGRRLTGNGQLKLADARMLVEKLPSGDVWDPVEFGFQNRTRSSAELPHLQRLMAWTTRCRLLEVDGDVLVPMPGTAELVQDLPKLVRMLTKALPEVARKDLAGYWDLTPLSEQEDLDLALAAIWQVLGRAFGPVGEHLLGDGVWNELTDYGADPFEEPAEAEKAVRRDVRRLLTLCEDVGLVHRLDDGLVELTEAGLRAPFGDSDPDDDDDPARDRGAPNYGNLFPLRHANAWQLTPRTAYVLHAVLAQVGDEAVASASHLHDAVLRDDDGGQAGVFARLPAATRAQAYAWRRDFARAAYDLHADITAGLVPRARCVAEQVVIDLALQRTPGYAQELTEGARFVFEELPEHRDDDWSRTEAALGSPHGGSNGLPQLWRVAPDNWFLTFTKSEPRPEHRGYVRP